MYYTYMLRCENNSIYTGITTDVKRRMEEHFSKDIKCAKYTKSHKPIKLECVWESENKVLASKLEYRIKTLNKKQKEGLIKNNNLEKYLSQKLECDKYKIAKNIDKLSAGSI